MELQPGKDAYSDMTFPCTDYPGCQYQDPVSERCIFNVARLQIRTGKACYEELRQAEIEAELDYLDDLRRSEIQ